MICTNFSNFHNRFKVTQLSILSLIVAKMQNHARIKPLTKTEIGFAGH